MTKKTYSGSVKNLTQGTPLQDSRIIEPYSDRDIVFPDLVYTLKQDDSKYHRPFVQMKDGQLKVVGNIPFYLAGREAGLKEMLVDVLFFDSDELNKVVNTFGLTEPEAPEQKNYRRRFLFFNGELSRQEFEAFEGTYPSSLDISPTHQCLHYKISGATPGEISETEIAFLDTFLGKRRDLRSIDGLKGHLMFRKNYSTQQ